MGSTVCCSASPFRPGAGEAEAQLDERAARMAHGPLGGREQAAGQDHDMSAVGLGCVPVRLQTASQRKARLVEECRNPANLGGALDEGRAAFGPTRRVGVGQPVTGRRSRTTSC
jgi:hypothetical protein